MGILQCTTVPIINSNSPATCLPGLALSVSCMPGGCPFRFKIQMSSLENIRKTKLCQKTVGYFALHCIDQHHLSVLRFGHNQLHSKPLACLPLPSHLHSALLACLQPMQHQNRNYQQSGLNIKEIKFCQNGWVFCIAPHRSSSPCGFGHHQLYTKLRPD